MACAWQPSWSVCWSQSRSWVSRQPNYVQLPPETGTGEPNLAMAATSCWKGAQRQTSWKSGSDVLSPTFQKSCLLPVASKMKKKKKQKKLLKFAAPFGMVMEIIEPAGVATLSGSMIRLMNGSQRLVINQMLHSQQDGKKNQKNSRKYLMPRDHCLRVLGTWILFGATVNRHWTDLVRIYVFLLPPKKSTRKDTKPAPGALSMRMKPCK